MKHLNKLSSVSCMWISSGLIAVAALMMFTPLFVAEGQVYNIVSGCFNSFGVVWPPFLGYMFILLGGLMTAAFALPFVQASYATEKIVLIGASILEIVGVVLVMTIVVWFCAFAGHVEYFTHRGYYLHAGSYITTFLTIFAILFNIRAIWLDK